MHGAERNDGEEENMAIRWVIGKARANLESVSECDFPSLGEKTVWQQLCSSCANVRQLLPGTWDSFVVPNLVPRYSVMPWDTVPRNMLNPLFLPWGAPFAFLLVSDES